MLNFKQQICNTIEKVKVWKNSLPKWAKIVITLLVTPFFPFLAVVVLLVLFAVMLCYEVYAILFGDN
jgi:hypothetical protein